MPDAIVAAAFSTPLMHDDVTSDVRRSAERRCDVVFCAGFCRVSCVATADV